MNAEYLNNNHYSAQAISASLNAEQATNLIIERAKKLVGQLIKNRGHDRPPFLPEEFCRMLGIEKIVKQELGQLSGLLLKFNDRYVIKVNKNHNSSRQNFSCAHEIGHILFSELKLGHYIYTIEYRTFNPQGRNRARLTARERLCDAAATELLMPEFIYRKYLSSFGTSIHAIERLSNVFRVSIQAAARRIAEVSLDPCVALLWERQRNSKGLKLTVCVGPGIQSRLKAKHIPVHTNISYPSSLHKAYESDSIIKSYKDFKQENSKKRLPMESKGFGYGEKRFVVSLAFIN